MVAVGVRILTEESEGGVGEKERMDECDVWSQLCQGAEALQLPYSILVPLTAFDATGGGKIALPT